MTKKSISDSDLWKAAIALSIVLIVIVAILYIFQILGTINLWASWKDFFASQISVYVVVLAVVIVVVLVYKVDEIRSAGTTAAQGSGVTFA
jgi:hypothetical protein